MASIENCELTGGYIEASKVLEYKPTNNEGRVAIQLRILPKTTLNLSRHKSWIYPRSQPGHEQKFTIFHTLPITPGHFWASGNSDTWGFLTFGNDYPISGRILMDLGMIPWKKKTGLSWFITIWGLNSACLHLFGACYKWLRTQIQLSSGNLT
jgi:hypothetical protein